MPPATRIPANGWTPSDPRVVQNPVDALQQLIFGGRAWTCGAIARHSEQIEFAGEAERNPGVERDLESRVIDPGDENAAIRSFAAEQGTRLLKLPVS